MKLLSVGIVPGGDGRDGAGIDAAAEIGADLHVGHELPLDGLAEQPGELFLVFAFSRRHLGLAEVVVPVPFDPGRRVHAGADAQQAAGGQHGDAGEERALGEEVLEGEVFRHAGEVDLGGEAGMLKQRLDLRREDEGVAGTRIVERLHPVAVPRQQELAFPPVPEREGEHAVEAGKGVLSPLRQGLQHDLRVGVRPEAPAVLLQLSP